MRTVFARGCCGSRGSHHSCSAVVKTVEPEKRGATSSSAQPADKCPRQILGPTLSMDAVRCIVLPLLSPSRRIHPSTLFALWTATIFPFLFPRFSSARLFIHLHLWNFTASVAFFLSALPPPSFTGCTCVTSPPAFPYGAPHHEYYRPCLCWTGLLPAACPPPSGAPASLRESTPPSDGCCQQGQSPGTPLLLGQGLWLPFPILWPPPSGQWRQGCDQW